MPTIDVVILAGGKGKRMGASVPKPLVHIAGKPMIAHLVETVCALPQARKPIVVVSPAGEALFREALGDTVRYVVQEEALGTGHAVRCARDAWQDADNVMVLYADHPFLPRETLWELQSACIADPSAVHLLTATVPEFSGAYVPFKGWGRILRNAMGEVVGIREVKDLHDDEQDIYEVNPGMYIFPVAWLMHALERLTNANTSGEYYVTDLIALALEDGIALRSTITDALAVMGVNTPEDLAIAEAHHAQRL